MSKNNTLDFLKNNSSNFNTTETVTSYEVPSFMEVAGKVELELFNKENLDATPLHLDTVSLYEEGNEFHKPVHTLFLGVAKIFAENPDMDQTDILNGIQINITGGYTTALERLPADVTEVAEFFNIPEDEADKALFEKEVKEDEEEEDNTLESILQMNASMDTKGDEDEYSSEGYLTVSHVDKKGIVRQLKKVPLSYQTKNGNVLTPVGVLVDKYATYLHNTYEKVSFSDVVEDLGIRVKSIYLVEEIKEEDALNLI